MNTLRPFRAWSMARTFARVLVIVMVTALFFGSGSPADAAPHAGWPIPRIPTLAQLMQWVDTPNWRKLPRQVSGTAEGLSHTATAASTRAGRGTGHKPGVGKGELPAYTPHARKFTVGPSAPAQVGFSAKTSKRVASKSAATFDYYSNADGSHTRRYYQQPINYKDRSGAWQSIDPRLRQNPGGRWSESANSSAVDFAPTASDPNLVSFGVDASHFLSYGLAGAAAVRGSVSGSTITYLDVLSGADLRLSATLVGEKEELVLHGPEASGPWVYTMNLHGLVAVAAPGGSINLVDSAGKTRMVIPAGYAYDSKIDPVSGEPASTHAVTYQLSMVAGQTKLTVSVDQAWLADQARVFPVTVDPTGDWSGYTTYAETGNSGDHEYENVIKIGSYNSGSDSARSFMSFPGSGVDGSGISVSAASLHLFDTWASTCTAERFDVAPVTVSWTASTLPAYPGPSLGSSIGNLTPSVPNACANTAGDRNVGDWVSVTLSTATFNGWAAGTTADYGLGVYASTSDNLHWKQFDSVMFENGSGVGGPYLELTFTGLLLPQVLAQNPADGFESRTLTPTLSAAGDGTTQFEFQVFDPAGTAVVDSGLIAANYYTIPSGKLQWGRTYTWTVQTYDGTNFSPNPVWNQLITQVPQPAITSGLSQNSGGHGFDASVGNYTTEATDADVATVGPGLSIVRDYNSRDPRIGSFGAGWSSVLGASAKEVLNDSSAVTSVVVTYPDGAQVGYGREADGSFTAPAGRAAKLIKLSTGYELIDKSETTYIFNHSLSSGTWGIGSIADANNRVLTFSWSSGNIVTITSGVSGRALHVTWSTPSGATAAHVATVTTDPVTAGQPATALTWTYNYSGDHLASVCPPGTTTACDGYGYRAQAPSQFHNYVLDTDVASYWPLAETSGTTAYSSVLANEGADNATYSGVTLGQTGGPLSGSPVTFAGFNGTSSRVQLPNLHLNTSIAQSMSLWFKTSAGPGVLFSSSDMAIASTATFGNSTPVLYVGTDGKLLGNFWASVHNASTGAPIPIESSASVADGQWHHVVLTGSETTQSMYLDGSLVGSIAGLSAVSTLVDTSPSSWYYNYLGTGYVGGDGQWPDAPHSSVSGTKYSMYFTGSIADAAFFTSPIAQTDVTGLYQSGIHPDTLLTSVLRPSGNTAATITYNPVTATVTHLVDENGGNWSINAPAETGSSQLFSSSVMGQAPLAYYRLGETAGASHAVSEVDYPDGTYANTTLGVAGHFADESAAKFNGTSSYVQLPDGMVSDSGSQSMSLWFNTTHPDGVLFAFEKDPITSTTTTSNYQPALYVGTDGKLRGELGTGSQAVTTNAVTDGKWHQVVLTVAGGTTLAMYLDGTLVHSGTGTFGTPYTNGLHNVYIGGGLIGGGWADNAHAGLSPKLAEYFNGTVGEFAYYMSTLSAAQVAAEYQAAANSTGLTPMMTVSYTDPGSHTITDQFDSLNGNREIAEIDGLGNKTIYGYDTSGFQHTVTDPNGDVTTIGHDVDGNAVSRTDCQNQATNSCTTTYTTYTADTQGVDVAANGVVTSSESNTTTNFNKAALVDGNVTSVPKAYGFISGAFTTASNTTWVEVDTGSVRTEDRVDLYPRNDSGNVGKCFPQDFTIDVSTDGTTWTQAASKTNFAMPTTPAAVSFPFTARNVRYVKVTATKLRLDTTNYYLQLAELSLLNDTPDATAGEALTSRDGRSSSSTDNTYLTSYAYDATGNVTSVTTPAVSGFPNGRTTTAAYTDGTTVAAADTGFAPAGLPYRSTTPGGAVSSIVYFHNGDVASSTDPDALVTQYTYDNLGRVLTKKVISDTYPAGLTTTYGYDGQNQVTSEVDPAVTDRVTGAIHTASTSTVFDVDGNIISQTVSDLIGGDASRTQSSHYNSFDQMDWSKDAQLNMTSYTYDGYGNKITETDPQGTVTTTTFDANGDLLTQVMTNFTGDPVSPQTAAPLTEESRSYDPAGRLATITNAMGFKTSYTYTDNGLVAAVVRTDQNGLNPYVQESEFYDAAGNLIKDIANNGATTTTRSVDAASRPTSSTVDPTGVDHTTTVSYTPDDAIATSTSSDASGATQISSATYDPMGHITSRSLQSDGTGHPVGWWRLNQTSGSTVADSSGTGNTASASSGVTWTGGAAAFDGTSGYIATNGPVIDTTQDFTISAWVKPSSLATTQVFAEQSGVNTFNYELYYSTVYGWVFNRENADVASPTFIRAKSAATPVANVWTHLVGVYTAATGGLALYVNGVNTPADNATDATPWNGTHEVQIGRAYAAGVASAYTGGSIGNVQVYARVLSGTEITGLYNAGQNSGTVASSPQLTTSWGLDKRGLPTSMTDPRTNVTTYDYDEAGHLAVTTAPTVNAFVSGGTPTPVHPVSVVGYNTFGDPVESKDPDGNITTVVYDANDRAVSQTLPSYTPPGGSPIVATMVRTYDSVGNLVIVTDPLLHNTSYMYDQLGDLAKITAADGGVTHYTYDNNGDRLTATDSTGAQMQATYDYLGRQLTSTALDRYPTATTSTVTNSYAPSTANPDGAWLASTASQNGATTSYAYNNVGEPVSVTDAAGNTTQYRYDYLGRRAAVVAPDLSSVVYGYDQAGDTTSTTMYDTDGTTVLSTRSASYDANRNMLSAVDVRGHSTTFTYDATDLVTQEVQPVSGAASVTTSFDYDAAGNRTRFTDGRGNPTISTYNSWNLPESTIEPVTATYTTTADSTFTTSYDADGRPVAQAAPGGVVATAGYDLIGDMTSQTGTGADAVTATRSFGYDHDGRIITAGTSAVGTVPATSNSFTYNDRSELLTTSGSAGSSSFGYNQDGLMTSRSDAAGTTSYSYDGADRLHTIADPATGTTLTYGYNTLSQPTSIGYGSGNDVRTFGYDSHHRLASDTLKTSAGATVASIGYGYDGNNNETSKTTTGFTGAAANTYTYDYANRLTSWNNGATTTAYSYDDSGNRIQVGANVYTYDARDELTGDGVNSYAYTARGTLSSQTSAGGTVSSTSDAYGEAITQGTQTYAYDASGRMLTATPVSGPVRVFAYTGSGNTLASDGSDLYSRDGGGGLVGVGVVGGGTGSGVLAFTDAHTDVVGQFAAAGGSLSGSTAFDPLGNVVSSSGLIGALGYQSGWTDPATSRVNMDSRWYNPAAGAFMNRDTMSVSPVPNSVDANPFAFVADNPMTGLDPSGHCDWWNVSCEAGAFVSGVSSAASSLWNDATSWFDDASSWASNEIDDGWNFIRRQAHSVSHCVHDLYSCGKRVIRNAKRLYHRATRYVAKKVHQAVHAVKTAVHKVVQAAKTTATFIKHHAGAIVSFVVSTVVFAGCEAALGAVTGGVGAIAGAAICGAAAGAVGGLVDQGFKCASGGKSACSAGSLLKAGIIGGVLGGVSGFAGGVGGKLLKAVGGRAISAIGGMLGRGGAEVVDGVATDVASGMVDSTVTVGADDTAVSAADSTATAAGEDGATAAGDGAAGDEAGAGGSSGCGGPHSFVGSTGVVLADGSAKPISGVKVGDRVRDAVPGRAGWQAYPVSRVIVTRTDHDFVDVTVAGAPAGRRGVNGLRRRVLAGLAAAALIVAPGAAVAGPVLPGGATLTTTFHHPFYDQTRTAFTEARDLHIGDVLQTPTGSTVITGLRLYHTTQVTYDLTIANLHTYYVEAGNTPVLVHNCGGSGPAPGVLEVSPGVQSTKAFQNYSPSGRAGIEYVFDPVNNRLLVGAPKPYLNIPGSPHQQLARAGGLDESRVLGGIFGRDANGRMVFNENSGHYGERWTDATRQQFDDFLDGFGFGFQRFNWPG